MQSQNQQQQQQQIVKVEDKKEIVNPKDHIYGAPLEKDDSEFIDEMYKGYKSNGYYFYKVVKDDIGKWYLLITRINKKFDLSNFVIKMDSYTKYNKSTVLLPLKGLVIGEENILPVKSVFLGKEDATSIIIEAEFDIKPSTIVKKRTPYNIQETISKVDKLKSFNPKKILDSINKLNISIEIGGFLIDVAKIFYELFVDDFYKHGVEFDIVSDNINAFGTVTKSLQDTSSIELLISEFGDRIPIDEVNNAISDVISVNQKIYYNTFQKTSIQIAKNRILLIKFFFRPAIRFVQQ